MSVKISYNTLTEESRWKAIKNGDFAILEGNAKHPIPHGLYRIFVVDEPILTWIIFPMFDGTFEIGFFPYMIVDDFPTLKPVTQVNISVEV